MPYPMRPRLPNCIAAAVLGCWLCALGGRAVAEGVPADSLPRHALEVRALTEPEAVLEQLPAAVDAAMKAQDHNELG